MLFFVLFSVLVEVIYKLWLFKHTRELAAQNSKPEMSVSEFQSLVHDKGRTLSIIDNHIVEIGDW